MKKRIGEFSTNILLEGNEPKDICRLGQMEKCCAFLVCGKDGFECIRMDYHNSTVFRRLDEGTMNAKGQGEWEECPWK